MNKVLLTGRLVADPDIRYSQAADSVCIAQFTVAVSRDFKRDGEPDADFIRCKAFGSSAEFIEKYFFKGMKMEISGHWQTGIYTNKENVTVYTNECIIERCGFAEKKQEEQEPPQKSQPTKQRRK